MPRSQLLASAVFLGLAVLTAQPAMLPAQVTTTGPAALMPADLDFVLKAAQGGMAEVALGELAQRQAGSEAVKAFGQKMVQDHGKANQELAQIASARGTVPPKELPDDARKLGQTLSAYAGPDFDRAYLQQQVAAHEVTLALFRHAAQHAQSPELREFASKEVPVIEGHLQEAGMLLKQVPGRS